MPNSQPTSSARGESLNDEQLSALAAEKTIHEGRFEPERLAAAFSESVRRATRHVGHLMTTAKLVRV